MLYPVSFNNIRFLLLFGIIVLFAGCTSLPKDVQRIESHALQDTQNTKLGREITPLIKKYPGKSGFHVLIEGMDAFIGRLGLIEAAEKSLDVQYYIWRNDLTGRVIHNRLLHAADRGVRVRLLLDDLDTAGKERILYILNSHTNIEVRLFNPFANRNSRGTDFITDLSRVNRRMHNKSLTADNQATIIGGRNIGDEYFEATEDVAFADLDVIGIGPVVNKVSSAFDLYWNSEWVYPLAAFKPDEPLTEKEIMQFRQESEAYMGEVRQTKYAKALLKQELAKISNIDKLKFSWGKWFLAYDQPSKVESNEISKETHLGPYLRKALEESKKEVIIISPYFVPGPEITKYLIGLVDKGIHVRILTNSLSANDVPIVHAGYMRYRDALVEGGVDLYEYKRTFSAEDQKKKKKRKWFGSSHASLHAKSFGFDRRYMFIGSFNLDARSIALNTEMGVFFESAKYSERMFSGFDEKILSKAYQVKINEHDHLMWETLEDGEKVIYYVEPETSWWQRFSVGFLSIFVPESQL